MPHKDKEARKIYMREYKERCRAKILSRRKALYRQKHGEIVDKSKWAVGHSDSRLCVDCGGNACNKPLPRCKSADHARYWGVRKAGSNVYRQKRRDEAAAEGRQYRNSTPEGLKRRRDKGRNKLRKMRSAVLASLGSNCRTCGYSDERALQLHHVNGGGGAHRRLTGWTFYAQFLASSQKWRDSVYELLCANCHAIKTYEKVTSKNPEA